MAYRDGFQIKLIYFLPSSSKPWHDSWFETKKTGENNLDCAKILNNGKKIVNNSCSYISSNNKESRNKKEA